MGIINGDLLAMYHHPVDVQRVLYGTNRHVPTPVLLTALRCHPSLTDSQGTVLNSWKAVWVVLSEDGVDFYKKKTDRSPKGMIPLKGATFASPCQEFGKRMVRKCESSPR